MERSVTTSGFNISGVDILTAGTLYKNISFAVQTAVDNNGNAHLLTYFVRFDNVLGSPWLNLKVGRFELDTLISEQRELTLSEQGGFYRSYHFIPIGDRTSFGLGDHQLGSYLPVGQPTGDERRHLELASGQVARQPVHRRDLPRLPLNGRRGRNQGA